MRKGRGRKGKVNEGKSRNAVQFPGAADVVTPLN